MVTLGPKRSQRGPIKMRVKTVEVTAARLDICTWSLVRCRLFLITGMRGAMENHALNAWREGKE